MSTATGCRCDVHQVQGSHSGSVHLADFKEALSKGGLKKDSVLSVEKIVLLLDAAEILKET